MGAVLAAPVVAHRDPPGHVGAELPEALGDGVVDRLEGREAVSHLGHMGPGLGGVVVHAGEDPTPPVVSGPPQSCVGSQRMLGWSGTIEPT